MSIAPLSILLALLGAAVGPGDIPPSSAWELSSVTPGGPLCRAMKEGDAIDTQVARGKDGDMLLVAGRPDWDHVNNALHLTISVDDGPPISLKGFSIGPTAFVVIDDGALLRQLKTAHRVSWTFPWGHFTAVVDGLGQAFDSIQYCPG
jgi:hypothetical protein